ncbi:hypothetical protein K1719_004039 [Acacia pycnantha]|nr:hypothetical protein K1719_004039 [Acacia pycnantha]
MQDDSITSLQLARQSPFFSFERRLIKGKEEHHYFMRTERCHGSHLDDWFIRRTARLLIIKCARHILGIAMRAIYIAKGSHLEHCSGGMLINDTILHMQAATPGLPFGGVEESGMGSCHMKFSFDGFCKT